MPKMIISKKSSSYLKTKKFSHNERIGKQKASVKKSAEMRGTQKDVRYQE